MPTQSNENTRFSIRIDNWLKPLLSLIKVTEERAFVELRDEELFVRFGRVDVTIPYSNVASVGVGSWRWLYGYGLRLAPGKTLGFVSARGPVVHVDLDEPQRMPFALGKTLERRRIAVSVERPEAFAAELRERVGG